MLSRQNLSCPADEPVIPPAEVDYAQRDFVNLVAAVFLLVLAISMAWTVRAMTEYERQQRCLESGRRDCVQIASPPQGMRALR